MTIDATFYTMSPWTFRLRSAGEPEKWVNFLITHSRIDYLKHLEFVEIVALYTSMPGWLFRIQYVSEAVFQDVENNV
jgi:hypothetical protein